MTIIVLNLSETKREKKLVVWQSFIWDDKCNEMMILKYEMMILKYETIIYNIVDCISLN